VVEGGKGHGISRDTRKKKNQAPEKSKGQKKKNINKEQTEWEGTGGNYTREHVKKISGAKTESKKNSANRKSANAQDELRKL